jgi:hypothetical protein
MRMRHVTVAVSVVALMRIAVIIARLLKVCVPTPWLWHRRHRRRRRRRHGVRVPLIVIVVVIVTRIVIVIVPSIVGIMIRAMITFIFGVCGNRRTRVPGLRVRCLRRRVVRIRGIYAWTVIPRVVELVLAPVFATIIRSRPGLASETAAIRRIGGMTQWVSRHLTERLCGRPRRKVWVCGKVLGLVRRRLSG